MMLTKLELDHAGIAEILTSQFADQVHAVAESIAGQANAAHPDTEDGIVVDDYVTDRSASSVTIRDPRAIGWEARDGTLTRAAAAAGFTVRSK